ncbi:MAG: SDR family NAD(P)-dependent oxidoreductase [Nitrospira sp.]|nr:SDR family NAD(P)-dependent oxidoreductase [Nitrospira sp.]
MKTAHTVSEQTQTEPIALVGIGCRFPGGVNHAQSFWELLKTGQDAIVDVPPDRWNVRRFYDPDASKPGKMYVKQGGFLRQRINEFDALFFGIAPREAECIDPQQRLLLETSWEALEDAGIPHGALAGSNTGVFIGAFTLDHKLTQMGKMNRQLIGTHTAIGSTMTILSNRISYVLDLRGPSMSLDTACSSSLVAVHLACQAIWRGECDLALAGGVNVMMRPEYPMAMCKGGFLAPDGRSKSFDSKANGYGRGEGAGVVVLKRVSEALRDGDSIYALIRGTGVNQDGRTNGITVPNPQSQTALIQRVCAQYAIDPRDVRYVEAHGTGTPVGDPLEAKALGTALGHPEEHDPCLLGSVKATIGHLEAAAGVAAIIKTALCLSHRQVPPQANLETPNPDIPFEALGLKLPRQLEELAPGAEQVCAGVNSFGYGGTNAHVVLQTAPLVEAGEFLAEPPDAVHCLPLSARSEHALTALAKSWLERFGEKPQRRLSDLAYSASCRRGHHDHRLAVTGASWEEMRGQLQAFVEQGMGEWLASGKRGNESEQQPVFVYTGMGPQWWAMGQELYEKEAVYRAAVEECDAIFRNIAGWSILEEMRKPEQDSKMADTVIAQPANFVIQVGLTALWRSRGVTPGAIIGHSVGEVAAAYVAGVLTLEDALLVSYHRSRIQKKAAGTGKMLAVNMSQDQCASLLKEMKGEVSIAAINSPSAVTLAGDALALQAIQEHLAQRGEAGRFLQVEVPYHSPFMEPLKPEVRSVLARLQPQIPTIPLYSTVTGDAVTGVLYDAEYWCDNIREPVYFAEGISSLLRDGHRVFLEVGPHPVLSTSIKECCRHRNIEAQTIASLRRQKPERRTFAVGLAQLYVAGCLIDWRRQYPADIRYVKLPTYPWQREVYWSENAESQVDRVGQSLHPLLDRRVPNPRPMWETAVNGQILPYLNDHQVDGLVVMPGAAYVEAGLAAFQQVTGDARCALVQLQFHQALMPNTSEADQIVHVELDQTSGEYGFYSHESAEQMNWQLNASGNIFAIQETESPVIDRDAITGRCGESVNIEKLYEGLAERGLWYGPSFRTIRQLQRGQGEVLARIELSQEFSGDEAAYHLYPSLLDGCFQSLIVTLEGSDKFYMPVGIKRLTYYGKPGNAFWCHGRLTSITDEDIVGEVDLFDDAGKLWVRVEGLRCRGLIGQRDNPLEQLKQWAYAWQWTPQPVLQGQGRTGNWLILTDTKGLGEALSHELETNPLNTVIRVPNATGEISKAHELNQLGVVLQDLKGQRLDGVVYCWGLDDRASKNDPVGMVQTGVALEVLKQLTSVFAETCPRLYIVTQGAQVVSDMDTISSMAQTPLVGLARVAFNEYPALHCTLVDVGPVDPNVGALAKEILADDREDDIALRGTERYVHRLERLVVDQAMSDQKTVTGDAVEAFRLQGAGRPTFHAMAVPVPQAGEVVVAVEYINIAGIHAGVDEDSEERHGFLATGTLTAVGDESGQWHVGDKVMIAAEGRPATHVVCPIDRVFAIDLYHSFDASEIAAVPTTFLSAYYALQMIARLVPGEAVLIDAALGARAIATHRIARWLGAKPYLYSAMGGAEILHGEPVIITMNQPDATAWLGDVHHFQHVRAWVHGIDSNEQETINLVLPPDTQELVFTDGASIQPISGGLGSCTAINAVKLALTAPKLFGQLLIKVGHIVGSRDSVPSVAQVLAADQGLTGLPPDGVMKRDREGVVSLLDRANVAVIDNRVIPLFNPDATYLITGGFGGFGLETAQWMAKRGAKYLALVGRRGAADNRAKEAVQSLEAQGVKVLAIAADMSDETQATGALTSIARQFPPLKGVFHAAAVLDDAPLSDLNQERLATVMKAKALSAWWLHILTSKSSLDYFVLFSSISSLIGNARQANYAAANTFLEALAYHRRAAGLPGTSVNWGAIATGMAIESAEVQRHLELMGISVISAEQALEVWMALHQSELPQYGIMDCDWPRWREFEPTGGNSPRFSPLMSGDEKTSSLTERCQAIRELPEQERSAAMGHALAEQIAKVLRMPVSQVDLQHSLSQMGVDSLMSVELQTAIDQVFGVRISTLELMRSKTLLHLAELLMERTIQAVARPNGEPQSQDPSLIDRMSALEIDILLDKMLQEKEAA